MENVFKETVSCAGIELIGLKTQLTNSQRQNADIIAQHWKTFNADLHKIRGYAPSKESWVKYGVVYREKDVLCYLTAVPHQPHYQPPLRMEKRMLPQGPYALFYHTGKLIDLAGTLTYIFKEFLPSNKFEMGSNQNDGIIYFEKYNKQFHWNRPDSIVELWVPVKNDEMKI